MPLTATVLPKTDSLIRLRINCPFCGFPFQPGDHVIFCPADNTPHHAACWQQNGNHCTLLGCRSAGEVVVPVTMTPKPKGAVLITHTYQAMPTKRELITCNNVSRLQLLITYNGAEITDPWSIAWSPDQRFLAVAGFDGVSVYDTQTLDLLQLDNTHWPRHALSFNHDGSLLASGIGRISLWSTQDWKLVKELPGHGTYLGAIAFSPDGLLLASGGDERVIRIWKVNDGRLERELGARTIFDRLKRDYQEYVDCIAFSPDGKLLVSAKRYDGLRFWRVRDGRLLGTTKESTSGWKLAFSDDGQWLVSVYHEKIQLWRTDNYSLVHDWKGHTNQVRGIALRDNLLLSSGSSDKTVKFWNVFNRSLIFDLTGFSSTVSDVLFSPDGTLIAVAIADGTIGLWGIA